MTELKVMAKRPKQCGEAFESIESASRRQGNRIGPVMIVVGAPDVLATVVERMEAVESLCYMRGTVEFHTHVPTDRPADAIVRLDTPAKTTKEDPSDPESPYWTVLRSAARLGMISGRGVPRRMRKQQRIAQIQRMTGTGWKQRTW